MKSQHVFLSLFTLSFLLLASCGNQAEVPKNSEAPEASKVPDSSEVSEAPKNNDVIEAEPAAPENITIELLQADQNLEYGITVQKEIAAGTVEEQIKETITLALDSLKVIVEDVKIENEIASINFKQESLESIVSSAQYGVLMAYINYAMVKNFPDINGYYLLANHEPTVIGESVLLDEMFKNELSDNMYLKLKDE